MFLRLAVFVVFAFALPALAQPQQVFRADNLQSLARPPIPSDPLELVTSDAQTVQTPEQRLAATSLLEKAHDLSNVRAQAYDLKTSFTAYGSASSDGNWTLEDISPGRNLYRWTAQGPGYSAINLYRERLLYSNNTQSAIPLRLTQVRQAIFFIYPPTGPYMSLRTANGQLNGVTVQCVLAGQGFGGRTFSGARNWEESEYCIDPQSGLLATYSPAPGMYVHYDYSNAIHFHNKIIPGAFTISEAGRTIIEAKTESVTNPGSVNQSLFETAGLNAVGVGSMAAQQPSRVHANGNRMANGSGQAALDVVVVIGVTQTDGHLNEAEILASSNPNFNQTALDRAKNWQAFNQTQSGTTPQSQEVIFTYEFVRPST